MCIKELCNPNRIGWSAIRTVVEKLKRPVTKSHWWQTDTFVCVKGLFDESNTKFKWTESIGTDDISIGARVFYGQIEKFQMFKQKRSSKQRWKANKGSIEDAFSPGFSISGFSLDKMMIFFPFSVCKVHWIINFPSTEKDQTQITSAYLVCMHFEFTNKTIFIEFYECNAKPKHTQRHSFSSSKNTLSI